MQRYILRKELQELIQKHLQQQTTEEENVFLDNYYQLFETEPDKTSLLSEEERKVLGMQMLQQVERRTKKSGRLVRFRSNRTNWLAAASILLAIVTFMGIYNYTTKPSVAIMSEVAAGSDKAVLTLADGSTILLDSTTNTQLADQGNVQLDMSKGHLSYNGNADKLQYNNMTTPRGGQYRLTLADGTKVWLNAQSSLDFPVAFMGKERKVRLQGEAYFEVAKNPAMPFTVSIEGKGSVVVMGTHFNIAAYPHHNDFATTLLEGSVKVAPLKDNLPDEHKTKLLMPGQQAVLAGTTITVSRDVDIDAVMAWKTGKFYFENTKLETILEEFSRWYDVDVVYQCSNEVKSRRFFMIMDRSASLNEMLKSLQLTDTRFIIEGKKLIIK